MTKRLTITIEEEVYQGLHNVVGRGNISQFINGLVRPHVLKADSDLEASYREMAADEARQAEALGWNDALIGDTGEAHGR